MPDRDCPWEARGSRLCFSSPASLEEPYEEQLGQQTSWWLGGLVFVGSVFKTHNKESSGILISAKYFRVQAMAVIPPQCHRRH